MDNNLVKTNECAGPGSIRLPGFADEYEPAYFRVDFATCASVDKLVEGLETLAKLNLHIVGSRGYVYDSRKQADNVRQLQALWNEKSLFCAWRCLTRSANIRETAYKLITGEIDNG